VEAMNTLGDIPFVFIDSQRVGHVNAPDDEYVSVLANLANRFRSQITLASTNSARLQRAPKGAGQSARGRSHHVVERGGVGLMNCRVNAIVLGHLRVHPKEHWLFVEGQIGTPQGTLDPLYSHS
jgi:hypothetical protein